MKQAKSIPTLKRSLNLQKAVTRLIVIWLSVALSIALIFAKGTYDDYRQTFGDKFLVRFYMPDAKPEESGSFFLGQTSGKNLPISWTNIRYLNCYRDVIGDNWLKKYSWQKISEPGGYVYLQDVSIKFWAYDPSPSPREIARGQCIGRASNEHIRSWVRIGWQRYEKKFMRMYLAGSIVLALTAGAGRWIFSGLRS
jgi:hypothetical protein